MRCLPNKVRAALFTFVVGVWAVNAWNYFGARRGVEVRKDAPVATAPAKPAGVPSSPREPRMVTTLFVSPIRRVDFLNFTYPNDKGPSYPETLKTFTLVNGEFDGFSDYRWVVSGEQGNITYADLTGDGEEEAAIMLFSQTSSSGGEHLLYVYTMERGEPKFLWFLKTYASGTDAGGVKDLYALDGDLVLELYGHNVIHDRRSTLVAPYNCDACYGSFTRVRFHWDGRRFRQKGETELHPFPGNQD